MNVVSGTLQPLNGHRYTIRSMAEEWRVSLVIDGRGGTVKGSHYRDLLRHRLGDDVTVSAAKMRIFLYTGSAKAAEEAGQTALAVLEEQSHLAELRLERWDGEEWRDPEEWQDPEEPAGHEDKPGPGRLQSTATALLKGAAGAAMRGDF
jgi:hypothetical protein